jgi:hypothetical protein
MMYIFGVNKQEKDFPDLQEGKVRAEVKSIFNSRLKLNFDPDYILITNIPTEDGAPV